VTDVLGGHVDLMFTHMSFRIAVREGQQGQGTRRHTESEWPICPRTDHVRTRMEEPRDIILAGDDDAHRHARPIIDKLPRRDVKVLADPKVQERMAPGWRNLRQQQIAGGLQDLYRR